MFIGIIEKNLMPENDIRNSIQGNRKATLQWKKDEKKFKKSMPKKDEWEVFFLWTFSTNQYVYWGELIKMTQRL